MGLSEIENRLERLVEGAFGRFSRKGIQPSEIGKKLTRQMELEKRVGVRGPMVPNDYVVALATEDFDGLQDINIALHSELLTLVQEIARTKKYKFVGFPKVVVTVDSNLPRGTFAIESRYQEDKDYLGHLYLELPNGLRIPVSSEPLVIGRLPGNTVVIDDSRVSRRHLQLELTDAAILVAKDLGSTNGTKVNGVRISESSVDEGDELDVGGVKIKVGRQ